MAKLRIAEDPTELKQWIVDYITSVLDMHDGTLSTTATFDTIGIDSVEAVVMAGVMEEHFGVEIDPMLLFESPTIDSFVASHSGPG